jgi:hypothetical protein
VRTWNLTINILIALTLSQIYLLSV